MPARDLKLLTENLSREIGRLVILHAFLEHWIDGMVKVVFDHVEGGNSLWKNHPVAAKGERDFLERSFVELQPLTPFRQEGVEILSKILLLADFRNKVVHGHLRNINDDGTLEFSRVVQEAKTPKRETLTVSHRELIAKADEIAALCKVAEKFTHRLIQAFGTEEDRKHL